MKAYIIYFIQQTFLFFLFLLLIAVSSCGNEDEIHGVVNIVTSDVSQITLTSLVSGGTITADEDVNITSRGIVWSQSPQPVIGKASKTTDGIGTGQYTSNVNGINLKQYYIRAYATVDNKIFYGNEVFFDHSVVVPIFTTELAPTELKDASKILTNIEYEWSEPITEQGICWATIKNPTVVNNKVMTQDTKKDYSITLANLEQNKAYYVRSYAITSLGIFYGDNIQILKLPEPVEGELTDIDGNVYKTVTIGDATWMAKNLTVSRYNEGTPIEEIFSLSAFRNTTVGAIMAYESRQENIAVYGYLYNGYVLSNSKNVCPEGWRVPTTSDWYKMVANLGGLETAGGRMKSMSDQWKSPNVLATNESGFSGLPGGSFCSACAGNVGVFADEGTDGYWWAKNSRDFFYLTNDRAEIRTQNNADINDGLAIRCIKE